MATKSGWTVGFVNRAVFKELKKHPEDIQAKFEALFDVIVRQGLEALTSKNKKKLRNGIWELRVQGKRVTSRALYLKRMGTRVIIVRVFTKKTQKTDDHEIELALRRAKEIPNA